MRIQLIGWSLAQITGKMYRANKYVSMPVMTNYSIHLNTAKAESGERMIE